MGEVYLARDVELDRTVAIKVLPHGDDDDHDRIRRFVQEARAAIALNHPNVAHIYDVGEESGVRFMAMEYVEGETLRARISRERLPLDTVLDIGIQTAAALGSAHALGIVHRDVKPDNVMLRPDGYVKVLDFGLAKLTIQRDNEATLLMHTAPGMVMGTMHYMAPEQLRGDDVDARADVFSLGVMLYEMVSGERPFTGSSPSGVIAAILTEEPRPLDETVPPDVRALIQKALSKKRGERFADARELADALKRARAGTERVRSGDVPTQAIERAMPRRLPVAKIAVVASVVLALAIAGWFANRVRLRRAAEARLPEVERLANERRYFEAYDLASALQPRLRGNDRLVRLLENITTPLSVTSSPAGAEVWVERVRRDGETEARTRIGTTPLSNVPLARGDYVLEVAKNGFAPAARSISLSPVRTAGVWIPPRPLRIEQTLVEAHAAKEGMVMVPGGRYRLVSWSRPTTATATLSPFFIDRFEVSNRDFARFVDGGGYQRPELWKHPFVKEGRTLTFDEAMRELRDATGLNAPRGWSRQKYPEGSGDHPVTGITWYEAAAYAELVGKSLPTVYQWEKAARDGVMSPFGLTFPWGVAASGTDVAQRANFRGNGPMTVASLRGGMSPYGAYHLAGNVAEWCANEIDHGRAAAGANFDSSVYEFGDFGSYPPFHSSDKIGFRCVVVLGAAGDEGGTPIRRRVEVPVLPRTPEAQVREYRKAFDYPPSPLNARVVERKTADAWIVEKIAYTGAAGETVHAYLFLPKHHRPPYQVVHYLPAGDVTSGMRTLAASLEALLGTFVRNGRAVFGVVLPGYIGRDYPGGRKPADDSEEYAELLANSVIDTRRGLDYLVSRPDIDGERIAFFGQSSGAQIGLVLAGVEHRYRSVLLAGVGLLPGDSRVLPRVSRLSFAPYLDTPLLMVHGRWDERHPLHTEAEPLFKLFPDPKRLTVYDGGHIPPPEVSIPTFTAWWDETMGPVRR